MTRRATFIAGAVAVGLAAMSSPAPAYTPNTLDFVGGTPVVAHWDDAAFPIPFFVTPGATTDIDDGSDVSALESAMATWSAVSDSRASLFLAGERAVEANVLDGINGIQFSNSAALDSAGFVSLTYISTDAAGTIAEVDVLVNDRGTGFTTTAGASVGLDLETVMLRELGKVLGLSSSAIGGRASDGSLSEDSAIMYPQSRPIGDSARSLRPDDMAGIVAMYPTSSPQRGTIAGQVTRSGAATFGAHVIAYDPIQDILIGAVSLPDGSFEISGLPPGRYLVEALPLVAPATATALGGIFATGDVDTTFRRTFLNRTLRVSAGARITGISLEVQR